MIELVADTLSLLSLSLSLQGKMMQPGVLNDFAGYRRVVGKVEMSKVGFARVVGTVEMSKAG